MHLTSQKFKISQEATQDNRGVDGLIQVDQPPVQIVVPEIVTQDSDRGTLIAATILCLWAASLAVLLSLDIAKLPPGWIPFAILWQVFLYTGLFITAHDAMHGQVSPQNPKLNQFIGSLAALVYGLFSYQKLRKKHWEHHHHPASELDPDFHDGKRQNFFAWYFCFMRRYWSWTRLIGLMVTFNLIHYTFQIPEHNLTLFWVLPPILSSVQLFFFGTFLPHREPEAGYTDPHRAQSNPLPTFWSFITCYHFGYHHEHHEYPQVAWWQLPAVYKMHSKAI